MQNSIKVFESQEFGKVEVLMIDGKPYFPAVEIAEILGYSKPHNAISRHCAHSLKRGVVTQTTNQHRTTSNQTVEKIFIPEGDLYRLIIRSKLPAAVRFESWVCDEVLPSVRKYGAYITDDVLEKMCSDSNFTDELLRHLSTEQQKSSALLDYVSYAAPKVRYYERILQCSNAIPVSIIAKEYKMTAIAFNKLLHKHGIQYRMGKSWLLYRQHTGNGYTVTRTYEIDGRIASVHMCWTQRGRFWLYTVLASHGILPEADVLIG